MSSFPSRLEYHAGLDGAPGDPFGRTEFAVTADCRARLVHRHLGRVRAWTGTIDARTLEAAWAALLRGGFPHVPRHPVPGGSALRVVIAHGADGAQSATVAWHAARDLPGYDAAFPILDSIVRQMSEDTVQAAPDTLPPVVSELVPMNKADPAP
jgi:hypothetical protein